MTLLYLIISLYIIKKNNDTLLNKLEYIISTNLFVSVSKIDISYNINNLESQLPVSSESHEILKII
jgi:hypothetical protein